MTAEDQKLLAAATRFALGGGVEIVKGPLPYKEGRWYLRDSEDELLHRQTGWTLHFRITDGGFLFHTPQEALAFYEQSQEQRTR